MSDGMRSHAVRARTCRRRRARRWARRVTGGLEDHRAGHARRRRRRERALTDIAIASRVALRSRFGQATAGPRDETRPNEAGAYPPRASENIMRLTRYRLQFMLDAAAVITTKFTLSSEIGCMQAAAFIKQETQRWDDVIRAAGIQPQ